MGVSDEVGEDISSTSNWPFELIMPLVVIEIDVLLLPFLQQTWT